MKTSILVTLFVSASILANAQGNISFDVHAGIGLAHLTGSNGNIAQSDSRPGFTGGVGIELPFHELWSVQAELNYQILGGGRDKTNIIPLQGYSRYVLQYASVPVLVKVKIPRSGLSILAGPQYGHLLNNRLRTSAGYDEETDQLSTSDLSAVIGAEYYFSLKGGNQIGLSGRYQFSALNIYKGGDSNIFVKNKAFSLTLGYRFSN
jgi:opacity protein-like surface antigen